MAHFDRVIPPGGEGEIRLAVRTKGYHGIFRKSANVYTNDPANRVTTLELKARVKSIIYVSSSHVYLYMKGDESIKRVIEIRAGLDKPLQLTPKQFDLSEKLTYTLEEIKKGRRFRIRIKTIPGHSQNYTGSLKFTTNYPEKPEIAIRIYGRAPREKQKRKRTSGAYK